LQSTSRSALEFGIQCFHIPTDIDIPCISSHVQAEALVQHAQSSILEMEPIGSQLITSQRETCCLWQESSSQTATQTVEEGMTGEKPLSSEDNEVPALAVFTGPRKLLTMVILHQESTMCKRFTSCIPLAAW
jgi:hypothetical protein